MVRKNLFRTFAVDVKTVAIRGRDIEKNADYRKDRWGLMGKECSEASVDGKSLR